MNQDETGRELEDIAPSAPENADLDGGDRSMDPDAMTLEDVVEAEHSRPTIPGETADGLDEMDEEVRRQAEDLPSGTLGGL